MSKGNMKGKKEKSHSTGTSSEQLLLTDLQHQHQYVESLKARGDSGFALVAASAFVKGMRDSGYRSTATALDELIDNAYQSGATRIDLLSTRDSQNRVGDIYVVDDGHGMEPDMIRASVLWGGTHRFNDRKGFGRYGFGLPSAAVSMTEHYRVFSKIEGGGWHVVEVDLLSIAEGKLTSQQGVILAPEPKQCEMPVYVKTFLDGRSLVKGTIVQLIAPDRLSGGFRNYQAFEQKMLEHLGVIYRGVVRNCSIYVNDKAVAPIDPLFTTPTGRFYEIEGGIRATALPAAEIPFTTSRGDEGALRLRFSYLPPKFQEDGKGNLHKGRFNIMKENNAYLIVTRSGRQVDLVSRPNYQKDVDNTTLVNYDRNWAIELDFDPVLDEEFGITVNKQQVTLSDAVWLKLAEYKLPNVVTDLRGRYKKDQGDTNDPDGQVNTPRKSEKTMKDATRFSTKPQRSIPDEQKEQARENLNREAEERATATGQSIEESRSALLEEQRERPFALAFEHLEGAPFYRAEQYGLQTRLWINRAHRFYSDFYSLLNSEPRYQAAIELLLLILGDCELEARGDRSLFYKAERHEWSSRLEIALSLLDRTDSIDDLMSAKAEGVSHVVTQ